MGSYINEIDGKRLGVSFHDKCEALLDAGAEKLNSKPSKYQDNLVCVVDNGNFGAAAYAFDTQEYEIFLAEKRRPTQWFIFNRAKEFAKPKYWEEEKVRQKRDSAMKTIKFIADLIKSKNKEPIKPEDDMQKFIDSIPIMPKGLADFKKDFTDKLEEKFGKNNIDKENQILEIKGLKGIKELFDFLDKELRTVNLSEENKTDAIIGAILSSLEGIKTPSGKYTKFDSELYKDDYHEKHIGDTVRFVSEEALFYLVDIDTNEPLLKDYKAPNKDLLELLKHDAVVVQTDTNNRYLCGHCDTPHRTTIIINFPDFDKSFHIHHRFVKKVH